LREASELELAQVLYANDAGHRLYIDTSGTRRNWDSLLRVIATRENVMLVSLTDHHDDEDPRVKMARTSVFLQAIQRNSAIQYVHLTGIRLSAASVASFIDAVPSFTGFSLEGDRMEENERERGAQEIAASL
jgi:hypothetical protein